MRSGVCIPPSAAVSRARTTCSTPRSSSARSPAMTGAPGALPRSCFPRRARLRVSPSRSSPTGAGSTACGSAPMARADLPATQAPSRSLMTRAPHGGASTCRPLPGACTRAWSSSRTGTSSPLCAAARRTGSIAASQSTMATPGARLSPRRCPTTTPASPWPSSRAAASPSRTTTTPRRAPTARRGRGRRCATPSPSRSPRTAASRSRSSATWSAARGTWARRTSSTTASTSTPASCRRLTA